MTTQPIEHKGYGYTFKQTRRPQEDVDFPLGPQSSKKQQEEVAEPRATVRDRIRALLAEVPRQDGNRLSFQDIADYRNSLEKDWDAVVSGDLNSLGVDMDRFFRLTHDPGSGQVSTGVDHPDKAKIDQYFASNPEMADDFKSLLQLGKMVDVAERKLSPEAMNQTLDAEAMGWWYQSNMDPSALFTGGGIVFGGGSSAYKGLDIRV